MTNRQAQLNVFLAHSGWADAVPLRLAGDASNRSYWRVKKRRSEETVIVMDAPPKNCGSSEPFVKMASYLGENHFSAPVIHAQDIPQGFLLLEDLGDDLFATVVRSDPDTEADLYRYASEMLFELHGCPTAGLNRLTMRELAQMTDLAFDWYVQDSLAVGQKSHLLGLLEERLEALVTSQPVTVLRDFHAENLIWLPERAGAARVGLLDFQDAVIGPATYDLVSLTRDARRDVSQAAREVAETRYQQLSRQNGDDFYAEMAIVGLQRNLRILGVFARLSLSYGKPGYVDLIPRVWAHVVADLEHPQLGKLGPELLRVLPYPDHKHLNRLR